MDSSPAEKTASTPRFSYTPRATRYEPCQNDACLSWIEAGDGDPDPSPGREVRRLFALLLDISETGAAIALDRVPRSNDVVRLRFQAEGGGDETEAVVVGVTTTNRGPHLVRLAFRTPCTFETLRGVICG